MIRLQLIKIYQTNKILLLLLFLTYSFFVGREVVIAKSLDVGIWEFLLITMTNQYYLIYGLLPIVLLIVSRYLNEPKDLIKIRLKHLYKYVRFEFIAIFISVGLLILLHAFYALSIGLFFFKIKTDFVAITDNNYYFLEEQQLLFSSLFPSALSASIVALIYLVVGLSTIGLLLSWINVKFSTTYTIGAAIVIFVSTFVGFNTLWYERFPILFSNNYFMVNHLLSLENSLWIIAILAVIGLINMSGLISQNKKSMLNVYRLFFPRKTILFTLCFIVIFYVLSFSRYIFTVELNSIEMIIGIHMGSSIDYPLIFSWIQLLVLYLFPLVIVGNILDKLRDYSYIQIIVRYISAKRLRSYVIQLIFMFLLLYWGINSLIIMLISHQSSTSVITIFDSEIGTIDLFEKYIVLLLISLVTVVFLYLAVSKWTGHVFGWIFIIIVMYVSLFVELLFLPTNLGLANLVAIYEKNLFIIYVASGIIISTISYIVFIEGEERWS